MTLVNAIYSSDELPVLLKDGGFYDRSDGGMRWVSLDKGGIEIEGYGPISVEAEWNEFNEGAENIHFILKCDDTLVHAEVYNDSWTNNTMPEMSNVYEVEAVEVTKIEYRRKK